MRAIALALLMIAGCGGNGGGPAADAARADAPVGGPDGGGPGTPDGGGPGTPDGGASGLDAGTGAVCGGFTGMTCGPDEYCDYAMDTCGISDESGTCLKRPMICPDIYMPVCACDGMVHGNACEAGAAGHDLNAQGGCTAPEGMFGCGPMFCVHDVHYCQRQISDVVGIPDGYSCLDLPASCPIPATCPCLSAEPCGDACTVSTPGDLTLTCKGG